MNDLVGGQIRFAAADLAGATSFIRGGRVRALAVASQARVAGVDVPSVVEAGFPNFDVTAWYAMFGPPGLPGPVVDRLSAAIVRAIRAPEIVQQLTNAGAIPVGESPAQLASFVAAEVQRWTTVARNAKITLD